MAGGTETRIDWEGWQAEAGLMQVSIRAGGWLVGEELADSVRER